MQKTTIAGHSLHSILMAAPAVLIPFGFILDALHSATGDEDYAKASYLSMAGGIAGGLAASVAGAVDYAAEKPQGDTKQEGQLHAALTGAALLAGAANLILRREGRHDSGGSLALSAIAAAGTLASSWFGMRMSGSDHAQVGMGAENAQQDVRIDHTALDVEQYVAAGPSTTLHPPQ
ncbi:DUF2231 domain-containing protein [Massilia sp. G4R7]|uniref:DUF2231 domain-containing protein n=1 Tax=Massilia phyllostachyos TaxID=2898585 RepID=A0ABS8Q6G2_9BURK|nr:DUF2231 domain-containing protein [Massilia phyllostachyos]MCD2517330.1 DUF2231 domain-containing protein [Massilia phyllostachyos]